MSTFIAPLVRYTPGESTPTFIPPMTEVTTYTPTFFQRYRPLIIGGVALGVLGGVGIGLYYWLR